MIASRKMRFALTFSLLFLLLCAARSFGQTEEGWKWRFMAGGERLSLLEATPATVYLSSDNQLIAVDSKTGKERWRFQVQLNYFSRFVVSGATIFLEDEKTLYALDYHTGQPRWSLAYGDRGVADFSLAGNLVFISRGEAGLAAADAKTGREIWHDKTCGEAYRQPLVANHVVILPCRSGRLYGFHHNDGRRLWEHGVRGVIDAVKLVDSTLYVARGDAFSRYVIEALDPLTGKPKWQLDRGQEEVAQGELVIAGGRVYFNESYGPLYALDAGTGKILWQYALDNYRLTHKVDGLTYMDQATLSAPLVAGETLYCSNNDGRIFAIDAGSGRLKWEKKISVRTALRPLVYGQAVLTTDLKETVYAFEAATGRELWTMRSYGEVNADLRLAGATLFFTSADGSLNAVDLEHTFALARAGKKLGAPVEVVVKKHQPVEPIALVLPPIPRVRFSQVTVKDELGYIALADTKENQALVYEINVRRGTSRLLTKFAVAFPAERFAQMVTRPVVADDRLYVGCGDGRLVALSRADGHLLWEAKADKEIADSPVATNQLVHFRSLDGHLYSYTRDGKEIWKAQVGVPRFYRAQIVADQEWLFMSAGDYRLYAINFATGKMTWRGGVGKELTTVALFEDLVIFGANDGYLRAVKRESGDEVWRYNTEGYKSEYPLVAEGMVYYLSRSHSNGILHAFDARTGKLVWQSRPAFINEPLYAQGVIFVRDGNYKFHALDARTGAERGEVGLLKDVIPLGITTDGIVFIHKQGQLEVINALRNQKLWSIRMAEAESEQ
jgi:outer membrane protein assembly factor BamB